MKRFLLPAILLAVIAGLLVLVGSLLGGRNFRFLPQITEQTERSAHTVLKEALPIGEYASLAYHYTTVVREINARDIRGWTIPFTTRRFIFSYDGIMKLGIDGTQIWIEEEDLESKVISDAEAATSLPQIRIFLPPIKILSHEIIDGSIEVFDQSQTIFNEIRIEDAFNVTAERRRELEEKVMAGSVIQEARRSAEQQLGGLLGSLPGIRDRYEIVFIWQAPAL